MRRVRGRWRPKDGPIIETLEPRLLLSAQAGLGGTYFHDEAPTGAAGAQVAAASEFIGMDIGNVNLPGSTRYDVQTGTYTVAGSGWDIFGTADAFHFAHRSWSGNGEIIAHVTSITPTHASAKAGVMFRETLEADSKQALMEIKATAGSEFQYRSTTGGGTTWTGTGGIGSPYWVRLVRQGDTFVGYRSADGANWVLEGSATIPMAADIYVGLAVTSHNNDLLNTATLDNVSVGQRETRKVLFVRGGPGTGGFLEGGADQQLSDIRDYSTSGRNHGWGQLADLLRGEGYELEQLIEGPAPGGTPINVAAMDLSQYSVIVLGSNNADYTPGGSTAHVDAVEQFVRSGGGLLTISDANWGEYWGDAPDSDQDFLDRFGLIVNQDRGTYTLSRAAGDFIVGGEDRGDHPVLAGVNAFDGEGVSPVTLGTPVSGVTAEVLAKAEGQIRVNNDPNGGSTRPATENDGALVVATAGHGRVACHFDRNTFFNLNGAGTNIHRHDNAAYARNLFAWLAGGARDTTPPTAEAWYSVVAHGHGVGEAMLEIPDDGTFCEPRAAGVGKLVIEFSEAIDPASFTPTSVGIAGNDASGDPVDVSGIVVATSTAAGDRAGIIEFAPALPDVVRYLVQIEGVTDVAGNPLAGDNDRVFTALVGDAMSDLRVNAIDLSYIWPRRTIQIDGVSEDQTRSDVNCDGRVNAIDLSAAWPHRGTDMRNVPDPVLPPEGAGPLLMTDDVLAAAAALAASSSDGDADTLAGLTDATDILLAMPMTADVPIASPLQPTAGVATVTIETSELETSGEANAADADALDVLSLPKLLPLLQPANG